MQYNPDTMMMQDDQGPVKCDQLINRTMIYKYSRRLNVYCKRRLYSAPSMIAQSNESLDNHPLHASTVRLRTRMRHAW